MSSPTPSSSKLSPLAGLFASMFNNKSTTSLSSAPSSTVTSPSTSSSSTSNSSMLTPKKQRQHGRSNSDANLPASSSSSTSSNIPIDSGYSTPQRLSRPPTLNTSMLKKMLRIATNQGGDEEDEDMQYAVPPNYVKPGSVKRTSSVRNATTVAQQQQQRQSGIIIPGMTISTPSPFVSTNNITRCESPIKQQTQTEAATTRTSERQLELLDLPDEIMTAIAMEAGFWGALALRGTCKQLFCLLDDKSSWHDYSRRRVKKITTTTMTDDTNTSNSTVYVQGPVDEIENTVTIETRLHTFDNLVFGTWRGSGCQSHDASALDAAFHKSQQESHHLNKTRTSTSPSYDIVMSEAVAMNNPAVFFEHKTFDERFDFLGGVQIRMNATGLASADFFDHRETLPCYLAYVDQLREAGELPPSIQRATPSPLTTTNNNRNDTNNNNNHTGPIDGGAAGVRVKHSCPSCTTYDAQAVTRSILIFDQVPSHPNWAAEGFTHSHIFPDEKRRLIIKVKPYFGSSSISGCRVADLPLVTLNSIKLNGRRLNSYQFELFRRLANGVGSARFVVR